MVPGRFKSRAADKTKVFLTVQGFDPQQVLPLVRVQGNRCSSGNVTVTEVSCGQMVTSLSHLAMLGAFWDWDIYNSSVLS